MQMGLEYILEAAKLMKDDKQAVFCFVGEGSGRKALESRVSAMNLDNVKFLPLQPRERLPEVFAAADALVASLRPEIRGVFSHPSKVWSIMASGRPVIGAFHDDTDAAHIINGAECGIIIKPGVPEAYVLAIHKLRNDPDYKKKLGDNGRKYAELHYNRKIVVEQYIDFFKKTLE
jgi:putative colanic acid biosynthesis glycosyltransferase WcaI